MRPRPTLLSGDSDVLWCELLMDEDVLDKASFAPLNGDMKRRFHAASVNADDFCAFYVATLARHTPAEWRPVYQRVSTRSSRH